MCMNIHAHVLQAVDELPVFLRNESFLATEKFVLVLGC